MVESVQEENSEQKPLNQIFIVLCKERRKSVIKKKLKQILSIGFNKTCFIYIKKKVDNISKCSAAELIQNGFIYLRN